MNKTFENILEIAVNLAVALAVVATALKAAL